jgi:hypothetical protein
MNIKISTIQHGSGQNDEEWLQSTYQTVLNRDLGDEGREYWLGDLGKRSHS